MCFHPMSIKSSRPDGVAIQYVPCGHCAECRKSEQNQWAFRMMSEVQAHSDWSLGFGTLTYGTKKGGYKSDMRPYLPKELFKNEKEFKKIPCFNKKHVQALFKSLREWLFSRSRSFERELYRNRYKKYLRSFGCEANLESARKNAGRYGLSPSEILSFPRWKKLNPTDVSTRNRIYYDGENLPIFLCCSEYGSTRKRPHYHFLILWNSTDKMLNPVTPSEMHHFIQDWWSDRFGFMFPKYVLGGFNGSNDEKPFVVPCEDGRLLGSVKYVCKYITKDIDFSNEIDSCIDSKSPLFKQFDSFHIQSRQLGLSLLKGKSDLDKLDYLLNGYQFDGEERSRCLPVYIRNKIIFDNDYVYEPGKDVYKEIEVDEFGEIINEEIHIVPCLKRLCRKKANSFFLKNYREIYKKKASFYRSFINKLCTEDFYKNGGLNAEVAKLLSSRCGGVVAKYGCDNIAQWYLSGYSRNEKFIKKIPLDQLWLSKYVDIENLINCPKDFFSTSDVVRMDRIVGYVFSFARMINFSFDNLESFSDREWKSFNLEPNI